MGVGYFGCGQRHHRLDARPIGSFGLTRPSAGCVTRAPIAIGKLGRAPFFSPPCEAAASDIRPTAAAQCGQTAWTDS